MSLTLCLLIALVPVAIIWYYRFRRCEGRCMKLFRNVILLRYLFLVTSCSIHKTKKKTFYAVTFSEEDLPENMNKAFYRLLEAFLKDGIIVYDSNHDPFVPRFDKEMLLGVMDFIMEKVEEEFEEFSNEDRFCQLLLTELYDELSEMLQELETGYSKIKEMPNKIICFAEEQ
ncbi:MAG: hypothetical protein J6M02_06225 [Clostridia bacterium]|nr:hypothetical protein [Clostridia bacterium]